MEETLVKRIQMIKTYINNNYNTIIGVQNIADACGENYNTVRRFFRNFYGITLKQYYDEIRIYHAKELLKNTSMKCYSIAKDTGFLDDVRFMKVFKRITRMTPNKYRILQKSGK
jgi:two-component system response regulator YesN